MHSARRPLFTLALLGLAVAWAAPAHAAWQDVATISSTLGNNTGRLCVGGTGSDIGCPTNTPLLDTAAGLLTVPTDLRVTGNLYVSGTQSFDGVTFANGGVSSSGTISASAFAGDGSLLTGVTAANADWYTLTNIPLQVQAVSNGTVINMVGISATDISVTNNLTVGGAATLGSIGTGAINASSISVTTANVGGLSANSGQINGDLTVTGNLNVSGSQSIDGVTFANGGVSSSGTISASAFSGDGSGITNLDAANIVGLNLDRITSNSQAGVTANSTGYISLTTGGVTGTAYFTPAGLLINAGVSTTGPVSATEGYISNTLSAGMPVRNASRRINVANGLGIYASNTTSPGIYINYINADNSTAGLRLAFNRTTSLSTIQYDVGDGGNIEATNLALDPNGSVGVNMMSGVSGFSSAKSNNPSTTLHVSGTIRIADGGESCDSDRLGAIKYTSGAFSVCQNTTTGWEPLVTNSSADRITSGTTSIIAYSNTSLTFTVAGTQRAVMAADGTFGINTTAPSARLHVHGTNLFSDALFSSSYTGGAGIGISSTSTGGGKYYLIVSANGGAYGGGNFSIYDNITHNHRLIINSSGKVGMGVGYPSTSLHIAGTLRLANGGESCDADRTGAIRYNGGDFQFCRNGTTWESLASVTDSAAPDRIVSGTTTLQVISNTGYISLTQAGTNTGWFSPQTGLVTLGVSTTGGISGTTGYFSGNVGIGTTAPTSMLDIYRESASSNIGLRTFGNANSALSFYRAAGTAAAPTTITAGNTTAALNGYGYNGSAYQNHTSIRMGSDNTIAGGRIFFLTASDGGALQTHYLLNRHGLTAMGSGNMINETPSTSLHVFGSVRVGTETSTTLQTCDADRLGAIRYASNQFYVCRNGTAWEALVAGGTGSVDTDRITSGTTAVTANNNGYISLTTGGTTTGYFDTAGNMVGPGVSVTGAISATRGYVGGGWNINYAGDYQFAVDGELGILGSTSIQFNSGGIRTWVNGNGFWTNEGSTRTYYMGGDNGAVLGVNTYLPSTTLHVSGTLRIANGGESCDADRLGALKYTSGAFSICQNTSTGWESLVTSGSVSTDRITSGTTGITAQTGGSISITTNGSTANYFDTSGRLVTAGISITTANGISSTNGYFSGNVGIGTSTPSYPLSISATGNAQIYNTGTTGGFLTIGRNFNNTATTADTLLGNIGFIGENTNPLQSATAASIASYVDATGGGRIKGRLTFATSNGNTTGPLERMRIDNSGLVGISTSAPSTTLHVAGTLRIADGGEACDADRTGAIKYSGGNFYACDGSAWSAFSTSAGVVSDRITSGTTSVIAVQDGAVTISASRLAVSSTIQASGAIQAGNADTTCAGSADYGKMRFDEATRKMYLCRP